MRRLTLMAAASLLGLAACGDSGSAGPGTGGSSGGATAGGSGSAGAGGAGPGSGGAAGSGGGAGASGGAGSSGTTGGAGTIGAGGSAGGPGMAGTTGSSGAGGGVAGAAGRGGTGGAAGQGGTGGRGGTGGGAGSAAAGRGGGGGGGTTGAAGSSGAAGTAGAGGALSPAPGQYGRRAMLPASNSEFAAGEVNGRIYIVGGYPTSPSATVASVYVYTIATDSWAAGPNHPIPVHHPVVIGVGGKLYSLGGQTSGADTNRVFELDPAVGAMGTWRELAMMPTARGAGSAAAVGDKIYVVAGRPPSGMNKLESYDISDNAWTTLAPLPATTSGSNMYTDRNHLIATAIGGKVYVAGGRYNGGGFGSPRTASLDIFDPATGMWTRGMDMPRPRGGVNGVAANGCFFVWGGEGQGIGEPNDVYPDHDVYNPRTNTWTSLLPLPTPIHGVTGSAFVNGLIFIPGGGIASGGSSGSNIFQVYRPNMSCE
jgi:N-acetylneuraminic acid mutarotase